MSFVAQPGRSLSLGPGWLTSSFLALPFPCQADGEKNVVPIYVWLTGATQHGWLLFGLEADPDVARGRKTGRRKEDVGRW